MVRDSCSSPCSLLPTGWCLFRVRQPHLWRVGENKILGLNTFYGFFFSVRVHGSLREKQTRDGGGDVGGQEGGDEALTRKHLQLVESGYKG